MRDEIISKETAQLAKEKGFNVGCSYLHGIYEGYIGLHHVDNYNKQNNNDQYSAPTQSLLQKWLRETHNIQVYASSHTVNFNKKWRDYVVYVDNNPINDSRDEEFQTYEEALEVGLFEALKII